MYKIQSIIFNKNVYNFAQCKKFITDNNFKIGRVDITKNYYRFRQLEPSYLLQNKYTVIKTKQIKSGIKLILYYKK